jgi:adenylate cyclase
MAYEIERKFLVISDQYKINATRRMLIQGYLAVDPERVVRVRTDGERAFLTIKGKLTKRTRREFEYPLPLVEAREILDQLCLKPLIQKYRYTIRYQGFCWEVDEFIGANQGLVIAEIEIESENQAFSRPDWLGDEVTHDPSYYNFMLVKQPYTEWK